MADWLKGWWRKDRTAANIVLNRYLTETRRIHDLDALAALPLFMSVRAAIRAKVTAARRRQGVTNDETLRSARDYASLAQRLLAPAKPRLIAIGGLSGTGKSLLARALATDVPPLPGAVVLRSDVERKALFEADETEQLPQEAYSGEVTRKVYAVLVEKARRVVAAGHSTIVDAVFAQPDERAAIEKVAGGALFDGVFLTADLETRLARVGGRTGDASDADASIARQQEQIDVGRVKWSRVDASGTPEVTLIRARGMLGLE